VTAKSCYRDVRRLVAEHELVHLRSSEFFAAAQDQ
jgi:hypothetical protein